ncbi:uncharacterized protein ACA1_056320 [Acanthamoeba castellanii str. Neff]|uniref:Uncharacterized protein n=1 Tax=Acanthamoeba castellanii (strain ATCC 30010 / Neff) TaxID=1257118 RepID=L8HGW4_ACACF|nr:uncharacterized protein ACA1_056320 [Acanthamoeba castellanii str. Neff]ELR24410.1 hypothetical protein ACA1_056320 [Acanthamoeba castellanii str. Neff]
MEVDEDQWKPRDKLLLVEAVTSGAAGGGSNAGNGNRGDSGGQDGKRDVNWAAVSRLLRKHIPKKRLTTPTSFGSKGLDRVVAALREEYMHHLRKSIELCDSEIQKSTERMTRIKAGDLDEELLAHYEEEKRFRAAGQSPPAAASVVGTASPPRKRRSLEDNGTSPLGASALAPASPLPAAAHKEGSP